MEITRSRSIRERRNEHNFNRHIHLESEVVAIGRNKEGSGGGGRETTAFTTTIKFSPLFLPSCSIYFSGNRGPCVRQIAALLFFFSCTRSRTQLEVDCALSRSSKQIALFLIALSHLSRGFIATLSRGT